MFQFTHFPSAVWESIYSLSHYCHQIGSTIYYPSFSVRSWNNIMCWMSFYILINIIHLYSCELLSVHLLYCVFENCFPTMLQSNIFLQMGLLICSAYIHIIGHSDASSSLHREAWGWGGMGVGVDGGIELSLFLSITSLQSMVEIFICVTFTYAHSVYQFHYID